MAVVISFNVLRRQGDTSGTVSLCGSVWVVVVISFNVLRRQGDTSGTVSLCGSVWVAVVISFNVLRRQVDTLGTVCLCASGQRLFIPYGDKDYPYRYKDNILR